MGLALKRANVQGLELVGYARRPEVALQALKLGAVDNAKSSLASTVEGANLVIIATPVMAIKEVLGQIAKHLTPGSVVTDTASTKARVMEWATELLPGTVNFIGGHPMAGKETPGIGAAEATLFINCIYCLTPAKNAPLEAVDAVTKLVSQIGAKPLFIDAEEHDRFVAGISHLPLVLSAALVSATAKSPLWPQMSRLAATGYKDLTRLASGDPRMSRDICLTNQDNILRWIDSYIGELEEYRHLIAEGDEGLEQEFSRAREARQRWLQRKENSDEKIG